jgi:hypothetical protein
MKITHLYTCKNVKNESVIHWAALLQSTPIKTFKKIGYHKNSGIGGYNRYKKFL